MTTSADVTRLLREPVALEVPFLPAASWWGRALRRLRRAFGLQRSRTWTWEAVEAPARHVIDYIDLTAGIAQKTLASQDGPDVDWAQSLARSAQMIRTELGESDAVFYHITGIEDAEFWAVLSQRQRLAITQAYERVNPAISDAKKKLMTATERATD